MAWWRFWERAGRKSESPDYYEEGVALARQELYHEALTSFRLALRENPEDAATLEQMAVVYTQIGVTDEAVKHYRRALEIRPSPAAHYGLAFLLLHAGDSEGATRHLRAFLDSAPAMPDAEKHVRHAAETLARLQEAADAAESAPDTSDA